MSTPRLRYDVITGLHCQLLDYSKQINLHAVFIARSNQDSRYYKGNGKLGLWVEWHFVILPRNGMRSSYRKALLFAVSKLTFLTFKQMHLQMDIVYANPVLVMGDVDVRSLAPKSHVTAAAAAADNRSSTEHRNGLGRPNVRPCAGRVP